MADESENVLQPEYPSKQSLFPIIGSDSGASRASGSLLFPSASFKEEERANKDINQPNWLRNESYKEVISTKSNNSAVSNKDHRQSLIERSVEEPYQPLIEPGTKRVHSDISSSDEDRELLYSKETKKEPTETRSHHRDRKKHKHSKKRKHKHDKTGSKGHISEDDNKPDTIWIEEAQLVPEKAFRLNKKPDLANRMYDTLYRLDIASYKMRSTVTCLGLSKNQVIAMSEKKGKKKKKLGTIASRYWNLKDIEVDERTEEISTGLPDTIKKPDQGVCLNDDSGFVSLKIPGQHGKATEGHLTSSEEQSNTDTDSRDSEMLQKTAELNKTLRENPQDIQTWLVLANFQEEIVRKEDSVRSSFTETGRERRKASTKTIIEKKIAVFEKALQQNPTSVELIVAHLDLCSEIMDAEELLQKWKKVSFVHPNNTLLWRHYVLFMQSRFSLFSFSKTSTVYDKCLSTLSSIKEGTFASHQADHDLESEMLDLFIQECQFARQSGHTEKAVACLQAMVELNCFCSTELEKNTPVSGQMAFLETFWDSGQPRFGEDGARGWSTWMAKENKSVSSEELIGVKKIFKSTCSSASEGSDFVDVNDDEIAVERDQPLWKNWVQVEMSRERKQLFPWQPDSVAGQTEEDCEDPERLVLFDDISSSLFKITDPTNKLKLVLSFLTFFGVSIPCLSSSASNDVQRFLRLSLEHASQLLVPSIPMVSQFLGLWQSYHWNGDTSADSNQHWPSPEALAFVRNIFVQSLPVFAGEIRSFLMVTWLWYEFRLTQQVKSSKEGKRMYKDVRKLARSLLKLPENRNDLKLWQAYAEMEWLSDNTDEARRVFDSTLTMAAEMFPDEQKRRTAFAPLVRSYVELEVGITTDGKVCQLSTSEGNKKALHILTTFVEGAKFQPSNSETSEVSAVRLVKCRRFYQKVHQGIIEVSESQVKKEMLLSCSMASGSLAVHLEACSALFEYLSSGVSSVLFMCNDVLSVTSSLLSSAAGLSELDIELILSSYIRLFKFHCNTGRNLPLKDTRKILHSTLEKFPDNPEFLSFYIQRESKSVLTGEIRRTLDKATLKATTPVPWVFALYYEQLRSKSLISVMECTLPSTLVMPESSPVAVTSLPVTGVVHRQTSLFERAASSSSARHCVALWRMFMEFESKHEKVKSVFYQALQNCPWAKVLYMDAVQKLPEDVQDIVDLMTEKEIRLRAPLEEIELLLQA